MRQKVLVVIAVASVFARPGHPVWGEEVPYTLEDRNRLIRIEASLREFKASVDKRFEQVDERFDQMRGFMGILASVFGGLVAVTIGFAVWDRRTALAPAVRKSRELEEREERIKRALRELAQQDPNVAEALRHAGLL